MSRNSGIQILIPMYNCADKIDATMQSIHQQTYAQEDIYVVMVDFSSTDGTYEKVLTYPPYHLGIYQVENTCSEVGMIAKAIEFLEYQLPSHRIEYEMLLGAGDVIYPEFFERCVRLLKQHAAERPDFLICETDLLLPDGRKQKQEPLFDTYRLLNGAEDFLGFSEHDSMHHILQFGGKLSRRKTIFANQCNSREQWMDYCISAFGVKILYNNEALACMSERMYEDELEHILIYWIRLLGLMNNQMCVGHSGYDDEIIAEFLSKNRKALAKYALWRSDVLYLAKKEKEALDCFLLAEIIWPNIVTEKEWMSMHERFDKQNEWV